MNTQTSSFGTAELEYIGLLLINLPWT